MNYIKYTLDTPYLVACTFIMGCMFIRVGIVHWFSLCFGLGQRNCRPEILSQVADLQFLWLAQTKTNRKTSVVQLQPDVPGPKGGGSAYNGPDFRIPRHRFG